MSEQQPAVQEKKKRPELSEEEKKKRAEEGKKRHEEKQKEHKEVACCEGDHVQPDKSGASDGHKKEKEKEKEKKKPAKAAGEAKELNPPPEFFQHRLRVWEEVKTSQQAQRAEVPIVVTLPDGKRVDATAFKTSPFDIAKSISQGLANACVAAKVNGDMWDLLRPLEKDSTLELVKFDSPEGKKVFWHSSAHVLGQALERRYGGKLCTGPAVDDGFYYDVFLDQTQVKSEDFADISALVQKVVSEKQPFERLALPKEKALEMFKYNPFKLEIIRSKVPDGAFCTAYRCGPLIDLCKGPHLPNTGYVKAFEVTKNSSSYWLGSADRESLQRVYGVSFPTKKELEEHLKFLEEAAARDHRNIGKQQELFFFHPLSPGCSFFLPHGARIYGKLMNLIRGEYLKRGFEEVVTPNVFNVDLWKTSGHWQNYQENMFAFDCDNTKFALKPMNCPGHCLMFQHRLRSYRELPIRFADFGVLHRNELSGALSGLTRVRRFQQDDAHIFCTHEQIFQEVKSALEFLECIYGIFGFEFSLELSTRPEKFLGEIAVWDKAEKQLADVLDACGKKWKLNPGDGAFYGPKIDIHIRDAINRSHQCATIQLDFQLPIRFKLEFQTEQGLATPVIIHRAILGSVERFMAILTEHIAGKWPFWISPRQCAICPVSEKFLDYAHQVQKALSLAGYYVDVKEADTSIQKKVRECQIAQYNYILVVGQKEVEDKTVNVRTRDNVVHGERTLDQLLAEWKELVENHK